MDEFDREIEECRSKHPIWYRVRSVLAVLFFILLIISVVMIFVTEDDVFIAFSYIFGLLFLIFLFGGIKNLIKRLKQ